MKFTSEDLLKFVGLKLGDKVKVKHTEGSSFQSVIYEVMVDDFENVILNCEQVHKVQISFLTNREYEIIQPIPILTEDEKVILRNIQFDSVVRNCNGYLTLKKDNSEHIHGVGIFLHLFEELEEDKPYSIEELLKE